MIWTGGMSNHSSIGSNHLGHVELGFFIENKEDPGAVGQPSRVASLCFSSPAYANTHFMRLLTGFGGGKDPWGSWSNSQAVESPAHTLVLASISLGMGHSLSFRTASLV